MPHHQTLQHGGFATYPYPPPAHPSSTDSDSMDRFSAEAQAFSDQNQDIEGQFFVGDLDLEQLDPWRRDVPSPMPRITDAITQALAEAALSPLSSTLYSPWDGDFAPPAPAPAPSPGLNEYATMQAQARGRGPGRAPPPQSIQPPTQSQPPPQYREEHPLQQPDIYYPYSEASNSPPAPHNQSFAPIYMAHNPSPSPTVPHHHHRYTSSMTGASSPAPLSDAEAEAKRIRNTAASARFRRKKKAREASLERQSREKREALAKLENRITELEDENKFLKGLILWKKDWKEEDTDNRAEESIVVEPERKGRERKDGVGT